MRLPAGRRLLVGAILLGLLAGMTVHYGATAAQPGHDRVQHALETLRTGEERVGEELYFWASVERRTGDGVVVRAGGRRLTVRTDGGTGSPGDTIQVAGTVVDVGTVEARRVVVSERGRLWYLYAVSVLGALVAAAAFGRHWTVRWRAGSVLPRGEGRD